MNTPEELLEKEHRINNALKNSLNDSVQFLFFVSPEEEEHLKFAIRWHKLENCIFIEKLEDYLDNESYQFEHKIVYVLGFPKLNNFEDSFNYLKKLK